MLRRSYHLGVRTYRIREAVVLYIGLEAEDERELYCGERKKREREREKERERKNERRIVPRSIAYTYDGKLPPILDKLSTILEECRREVTTRSYRAKPTICQALKANCTPV